MRLRQPRRHRLKHTTSRKSRKWSLCDFVEKRARPQGTICRFRNVDFSERMSPARDVIARSLLRLLELGAMASSALASEAVCLDASRILAGRDRGDERQNHNDDRGHRRGARWLVYSQCGSQSIDFVLTCETCKIGDG